jgi:hypothetical protein
MSIVVGRTLEQFNQSHSLGESPGGNVIYKNGGIIWIVAPASTEVSRVWNDLSDAITTASAYTNAFSSASYASPVQNHPGAVCCSAWFIPSLGQLQNPAYPCRTYWDSYSCTYYWSTSSYSSTLKRMLLFTSGACANGSPLSVRCVRAFRCVTY